ncbi:MAG: hypothetical protein IPM98_18010 [Lewinellaceae bacterium]|nr:hypothetical protein [Lewinellaceae bacterium]
MKIKKQQLIQLALGLVVGAICGYAGMQFGKNMGSFAPMDGPVQKTATIAVAFFAIWFALAFHELAHLVTGLGQGFRFQLYVAGFLGIRRDPETERITPYWNTDMQLFGGVAATLPQEDSPDLIKRFAQGGDRRPAGVLGTGSRWRVPAGWALSHAAGVGLRLLAVFLSSARLHRSSCFWLPPCPAEPVCFHRPGALLPPAVGRKNRRHRAGDARVGCPGPFGRSPWRNSIWPMWRWFGRTRTTPCMPICTPFSHYLATDQPDMAVQVAERLHELPDEMPALFRAEAVERSVFAAAYLKNDAAAANAWWQKIEKQLAKRHDVSALRVKSALSRVNGEPVEATHLARTALALLDKKPVLNAGELLERQLLYTSFKHPETRGASPDTFSYRISTKTSARSRCFASVFFNARVATHQNQTLYYEKTLFSAFLLLVLNNFATARSAEEIIAKHIRATGDNWSKVEAVKMEANIASESAAGMAVGWTMTSIRNKGRPYGRVGHGHEPNLRRQRRQRLGNQPFMGQTDPEPLTADQVKSMMGQTDIDGTVIGYKEKATPWVCWQRGCGRHRSAQNQGQQRRQKVRYILYDRKRTTKSRTSGRRSGRQRGRKCYGIFQLQNRGRHRNAALPAIVSPMMGNTTITLTKVTFNPTVDMKMFDMPKK